MAWLADEVADLYRVDNGRPGIDPEVALRLMLAGLLLGIVHDRRLMREAQVNLAIRWFCGYGVHERLPDHSSLTRIRQRWGAERFKRIFARTVAARVARRTWPSSVGGPGSQARGIVEGEVVHIDRSLVRANVSREAIARRHSEAVAAANGDAADHDGSGEQAGAGGSGRSDKVAAAGTSDFEASLTTNHRARRSEPDYKQDTAADGERGVVLDVAATTGAVHDTVAVDAPLDVIPAVTGAAIQTATMDGRTPSPACLPASSSAASTPSCRPSGSAHPRP